MFASRYGLQGRSEAASGSNKTLDDLEDDEAPPSSSSAAAGPLPPVTGPTSRRRRCWPTILSVIETTPTNLGAREKALDIQAGNVEAEGKEAIGSSIQSQEEEEEEPEESAVSSAYLVSYFIAGGAAGAASRTVVSPLERLKSESCCGCRAAEP